MARTGRSSAWRSFVYVSSHVISTQEYGLPRAQRSSGVGGLRLRCGGRPRRHLPDSKKRPWNQTRRSRVRSGPGPQVAVSEGNCRRTRLRRVRVELRGFEPLTPCMPCKCSARLSYSPVVRAPDCIRLPPRPIRSQWSEHRPRGAPVRSSRGSHGRRRERRHRRSRAAPTCRVAHLRGAGRVVPALS